MIAHTYLSRQSFTKPKSPTKHITIARHPPAPGPLPFPFLFLYLFPHSTTRFVTDTTVVVAAVAVREKKIQQQTTSSPFYWPKILHRPPLSQATRKIDDTHCCFAAATMSFFRKNHLTHNNSFPWQIYLSISSSSSSSSSSSWGLWMFCLFLVLWTSLL